MRAYLEVKNESLAAEARIIRRKERLNRHKPEVRAGLHDHRVNVVRPESRSTQLALAFLRGVPAVKLEGVVYRRPDWTRVEKLVKTYGEGPSQQVLQRFAEWREGHPLGS